MIFKNRFFFFFFLIDKTTYYYYSLYICAIFIHSLFSMLSSSCCQSKFPKTPLLSFWLLFYYSLSLLLKNCHLPPPHFNVLFPCCGIFLLKFYLIIKKKKRNFQNIIRNVISNNPNKNSPLLHRGSLIIRLIATSYLCAILFCQASTS